MSPPLTPQNLPRIFGVNVRTRRVELGLTQAKLAERLKCPTSYISAVENGSRNPRFDNQARFAAELETTPAALLTPISAEPRKKLGKKSG